MALQLFTKYYANDVQGTILFAEKIKNIFKIGDTILLYGELGSGKTFLIREIVKQMGMKDVVSSPSFSILNQYKGDQYTINHIDLYRIKDPRELSNLGLEDFWQGPYINFVEWPQLLEKYIEWPHYRIEIKTDHKNPTWRKFSLKNVNPGN